LLPPTRGRIDFSALVLSDPSRTDPAKDKAKIQTYCEIRKLSEQIEQASAKKDDKTLEELSVKIETLEKNLGAEYVALLDGLQDVVEDDQLGAEFVSALTSLDRLCPR
jgi:hypothetical protein